MCVVCGVWVGLLMIGLLASGDARRERRVFFFFNCLLLCGLCCFFCKYGGVVFDV